jgi:trimeric autotransporter adhesin
MTAQVRSSAISGLIMDSGGAVVPNASVEVTEDLTGVLTTTVSNSAGEFTVPYLPAGTYTLRVKKDGFKAISKAGIVLGTTQAVRLDLKLDVGRVETSIEISADAVQIQTDSPTVQNSINETVIKSVPNINNNPFYFAALQAGVVGRASFNDTTNINSFGIGAEGRRFVSSLTVNGSEAFSADIKVDGISIQGSAWNEAAIVPNREGLQEVMTITNSYSAEYGRGSGVISLTTKSGTNEIHGSAVYRARNEAFNANTFENNNRGFRRNPFKVHSYSATLGGPIVKNKLFFFASYEGLTHGRAVDFLRTVPTAEQRVGDFSKTLVNVAGVPTPVQLFNPLSAVQTGTNQYQRSMIPGADIRNVPGLLDPNMVRLMSNYPLPNRTPDDVFNTNNYSARRQQDFSRNSINSRIDYKLGADSLYGSFGLNRGAVTTPGAWGADNPFYSPPQFIGQSNSDRNPYAAIGLTHVFSPALVADIRYGITRIFTVNQAYPGTEPFNYGQFGVPANVQSIISVPNSPPDFGPGGGISALANTGSLYKLEGQTNHGLNANFTYLRSRWTHKFGAEYRVFLSNYSDPERALNIVTRQDISRELVDAQGLAVGAATNATAGFQPASALMGFGRLEVNGARNPLPAFAQKYAGFYSQNDWRATNKLQIFLGLRYDIQPGLTERFNRIRSIDLNSQNAFNGNGLWVFPGSNGAGRNLYQTEYNNWGPRFGAAYRLSADTVLRGGYGLTYLPSNTGYFATGGFYGMDAFAFSTLNDNNVVYGTSPNGIPLGRFNQVNSIVPPIGPNPSAPRYYGASNVSYFPNNGFKNSYLHQWNVTLERRFAKHWLVSAGYVASKGKNLPYSRLPINSNQFVNPSVLADCRADFISRLGLGNKCNDRVPNPYQRPGQPVIPFSNVDLRSATVPFLVTQQRYPFFPGTGLASTIGYSDYHSLQLVVTKAYSSGIQLNANYVWSKALAFAGSEAQANGFADGAGYSSNLDLLNLANNRSLASTDVPHRLVATVVYDLPFGAGKRFGSKSGFVNALAGGWRLSGVFNAQAGTPIYFNGASSGSLNGRPDYDPKVSLEVPKELQRWYDGVTPVILPSGRRIIPCNRCFLKYNSDAFTGRTIALSNGTFAADQYWWGNAAPTLSILRNLGLWNTNLTVMRDFKVTERIGLQFSAQATNAFNRTQFRPNINAGLGGTNALTTNNGIIGLGTNDNFGTHSMATFDPRQIEFHLRVRF